MKKIIYNGKIINEDEATINISDKGYFFDFAIYSSIKVVQKKVFFSEYHVDRLFESANIIDLKHQFTKEQIMEWLDLVIRENNIDDGLLRIIMIGDTDNNSEAKLFIFCVTGLTFYAHKLYKKGAIAITYIGERRFPKAKTTDLLLSFLALREAKKASAIDALLVDREGFIREGTRSNFYAFRGNELVMPPTEKVLEGVTKKIVLEIAKDKFKIVEEDIPCNALEKYDEFFISSTLMNVMPIKQIDDYEIHSNFENTKTIIKLFKNYYEKNMLGNVNSP